MRTPLGRTDIARRPRREDRGNALVALPPMWESPEEARSDFILAAATAVFGPLLYFFAVSVLPLGQLRLVGDAVRVGIVFAISGVVPVLLARYRGQGAAAFGLNTPVRDGITAGLVVAAPLVGLGIAVQWADPASSAPSALLGVLGHLPRSPLDLLVWLLLHIALFTGALLLYAFLAAKAREAFRGTEIGQVEALRTFGMVAAAAGFVVGLPIAAFTDVTLLRATLGPLALAVAVLLADRFVVPGAMTTRATVLAPAIVAAIIRLELFGGRFLLTLRQAVLAGGLVLVLAVLIETRRYAWAIVPILLAVTLYPSSISPFVRLGP